MRGSGRLPGTPLVGREAELELLTGHLDATRRGLAGFALLVAEAGIGKSRLVVETVRRARERGFDVVETAAYELEHARPFGPLVDAIPSAAELDGFRLQEHVVAHLEARAVGRPVLLTLEDAHWSDVATLGAIASCVRRLSHVPFFALLSARPLPRPPELDGLMGHADVVVVEPLDDEAVSRLVTDILGAAPGPTLRRTVAGASGNPFFVGELVDALRADGAIDVRGDVAETVATAAPQSLRMSMLRRMGFLTRGTLDALRLASVLGSSFTVSDLAVVAEKPAADLLPAIDEAVRGGVLEERDDGLRFRHDLLREALYEDMPLSSRVALHLDCARALAAAGRPAERVAPHFAAGAVVGDTAAVDWLSRAGDAASRRDPAAALELYEHARRLMRLDDPGRVPLDIAILGALHMLGRPDELVARAARLTHGAGPDVEASVIGYLVVALFARGDVDDALARADAWVSRADVPEALRFSVLTWVAVWRAMLGRPGARELAEDAVRISGRFPSGGMTVAALMSLSTVLRCEGRVGEAVAHAEEAVRRSPGAVIGPPGPWAVLAAAYIEADRLEDAERVIREDLRRVEDVGFASTIVLHHRTLADVKYVAGDWDEAVAEAETADEIAQEIGEARRAHVELALVAVHRNRLDEAAEHLDRAAASVTSLDLPWARALWHECRGDPEAALRVLRDGVDDPSVTPPRAVPTLPFVDLARLAIRSGDRPLAERASQVVTEDAGRRDTPTARGNALRCAGLLHGDADTLLEAVDEYRSGPRPLELALALEDAAAALARAGRPDEATPSFREALAGFERLGADWDVARCQATARASGIHLRVRRRRATARTGWESLSPTEANVARLAATGLSNPEIGRRLYISRRTVETHLSHVFSKLGLASRVELAGAVARMGDKLVDGGKQS